MCSMYCIIVKSTLLRVKRQIGQIYLMYMVGGQCSFELYLLMYCPILMCDQCYNCHCYVWVRSTCTSWSSSEMWIAGCWLWKPWLPGLFIFFCFRLPPQSAGWRKDHWLARCCVEGAEILTDMRWKISFPAVLTYILKTSCSTWVQGGVFNNKFTTIYPRGNIPSP